MYYFRITLDRDGWRPRFYARSNGRLMWWTEGYRNRSDAEHAVGVMQTYAATSPVT